jgi:hypothetical protein
VITSLEGSILLKARFQPTVTQSCEALRMKALTFRNLWRCRANPTAKLCGGQFGDHIADAQRYERTEARRDTRAGHYERNLHTK